MEKSKSIAAIVGPVLLVMVTSELRLWNPNLYDEQIVPLVYLSGVLLFIAGLSIIRVHNIWIRGWQTTLTLVGWFSLLLGLSRMFFPHEYKAQFKNDNFTFAIELLLICLGVFLTFKAYLSVSRSK